MKHSLLSQSLLNEVKVSTKYSYDDMKLEMASQSLLNEVKVSTHLGHR